MYVWDTSNWTIVAELRGHKFGVSCGCFSPNNKYPSDLSMRNIISLYSLMKITYLVTVGFQHDGNVFVWDWKSGTAAASNKITTKVYAVS